MKIALFIGSLHGGGAERQLALLARGLAVRGHDIEVWVYDRGGNYEVTLQDLPKAQVIQIGPGQVGPLRRFLAVRTQVQRTDVDVLHPYLEECCVYASLALFGKNRVKLVWGVRNSGVRLREYGWKVALLQQTSKLLSRLPDLLIFNSDAGRSKYPRSLARTAVIPNGIDTIRFRPSQSGDELNALRTKYGLPQEKKLILFVGRKDPMKGLADLLQVADRVTRESQDCHFVIAGVAIEEFNLDVSLNARISVLGRVAAPEELMRISDILLSTSRFGEGFPNVLAEAIASGCHVIATDVGDARIIVGADGAICEPGDVTSLTSEILASLKEPIHLQERNRRHARIKSKFGLDLMISRTEHCLKSLFPGEETG